MKKKLFIILIALLALPGFVLAANDVTFPQATNVTLADGYTYVIDTDSTFDSFTVNTANIQFTVSASSIISMYQADRIDFGVSGTNEYMTVTEQCTNSQSNVLIVVSASAPSTYTVTFTPSGSCASSAGGGTTGGTTGGGGGGGGGGGTPAPAPVATTPAASLASLDTQSSSGGAVSLPAPATATVASSGGEAALSDNSIALALPANAVTSETTVTITPQATFAQPSAGFTAVGSQVYNITAQAGGSSVTQLGADSNLTFTYTDAQIANINEGTLVVSYWAEETGEWVNLPTTINAESNTVTATVNHFTKFILQGESNTAPAGSLIKTSSSSAVYYLGHDNKRYVFPDDKVYYTWYENFDDVITVSATEMISHTLGGNITTRGGTKLAQFVAYDYAGNMVIDDPKIYALEPGGVIRHVTTGDIASALYGATWESKINPVPNYLYSNYAVGSALTTATFPTGSLISETSTNNLYYINGAEKRLVTTNGRTSNRFQQQYYLSNYSLASYTLSASLNDYQNSISWTGGK